MKKIFISQAVLDRLFSEEKAELQGDKLVIYGREHQVYNLTPAYKFTGVADDSPDKKGLVGKIYVKSELEKISADIYMDSAIIDDIPYNVQPGYVGAPEQAAATEPQGRESSESESKEVDEQELLSDYLLKIL
ncbi:MAG: hypothetical protein R6V10_05185 [bacterium]